VGATPGGWPGRGQNSAPRQPPAIAARDPEALKITKPDGVKGPSPKDGVKIMAWLAWPASKGAARGIQDH